MNVSNDAKGEAQNNLATNEINENSGCDIFDPFVSSAVEDTDSEINQYFNDEVINQSKVDNETKISGDVAGEKIETESLGSIKPLNFGQAEAQVSGNPEIDIDLTDPAVEAAATKIQSAFKGFKKRKNVAKL